MECPICSKKFPAQEITKHVDQCLDEASMAEESPTNTTNTTTTTSTTSVAEPAPMEGVPMVDLTTEDPVASANSAGQNPPPFNPEFGASSWAPFGAVQTNGGQAPLTPTPSSTPGTPTNPFTNSNSLTPPNSTPVRPHSPVLIFGSSSFSSTSSTTSPSSTSSPSPSTTSTTTAPSTTSTTATVATPMETAPIVVDDEEAELARLQMEAFIYWQRRREQEEEDMRLARQLQEETAKTAASGPASPISTPISTPTPTTPKPSPTITPVTTPTHPVGMPVPTPIGDKTPLRDSDVVRQIMEEEERKRREAEEADRRIAEELWQKEKEEEEVLRRKRELDEALNRARLQAKTESDEEYARLLKEKEDLRAELERLRAQEIAAVETGDSHVAVNLQGIEYPERWQKQRSDFQSFDVSPGSEEWNEVTSHFNNTVGTGAHITRIERNQNRTLWTFYYLRRQQVALKNRKDPNEKLLFHGSRANAYDTILKDGFDHRVANMGGAIGAGVYFATHASTSTGYVTGGHTKKMLYCRVTLGSVGVGKSGMRRPPDKRGGGIHDSVGQVHSGNGMYVVFDNAQAYPEYVIHYR